MRKIRVNALRVIQQPDVPLYVFGVNGRLISQFSTVDFAQRKRDGALEGYQRDRVTRHIAEIEAYLKQETSLLPNAIVLALSEQVTFTKVPHGIPSEWGSFGTLSIPIPSRGEDRPAFIVDGQQRVTALSRLDPKRMFPVVVVAFQSVSDNKQREQFVLVNKTKPLPRDLINELLPQMGSEIVLTRAMESQRFAARVLERLRFDSASPFCGRIKGIGATGEGATISQAAVIGVVKRSIKQGGALSAFNTVEPESVAVTQSAKVMSTFFRAVEQVWPSAWAGSPRNSRLVHGAGIHAMGALMDVVMQEIDVQSPRAVVLAKRRIFKIKRRCRWTEGRWPRLRWEWNEIENTSVDKRRLAEYIVKEYRKC